MDLIIYCVALFILGMIRVNQTTTVSNSEGIVSPLGTSVECSLPYGQNLQMYKEVGAYTLILQELRLI